MAWTYIQLNQTHWQTFGWIIGRRQNCQLLHGHHLLRHWRHSQRRQTNCVGFAFHCQFEHFQKTFQLDGITANQEIVRRLLEWDCRLAIVHEFHVDRLNVALDFVACARLVCVGEMNNKQIVEVFRIWWMIAERKRRLLRSGFHIRRQTIMNGDFANDFHCAVDVMWPNNSTRLPQFFIEYPMPTELISTEPLYFYLCQDEDVWKWNCQKSIWRQNFRTDLHCRYFDILPRSSAKFEHFIVRRWVGRYFSWISAHWAPKNIDGHWCSGCDSVLRKKCKFRISFDSLFDTWISDFIHVKRQQRLSAVWLKVETFEEFLPVFSEQCRLTTPIGQHFHQLPRSIV